MSYVYDVLSVAYYLAFLTFYLGVLIYALPIPWRGLKSWAPRLIGDSILAIIMITLYIAIVGSTDYLLGLLGGSWDAFWSWVKSALAFASTMKALVVIVLAAAKAVNASWVLSSITWPIDRVVNLVIITVATLSGIGWLVSTYRDLLIALGIALLSLPLRIGRGAGAWLIAFSVVFYIGLPNLPVFSTWLIEAPHSQEDFGFAIAKASVVDYEGLIVGYGVLVLSTTSGDTVSIYPIEDGVVKGKLGPGYISFPSNTSIYAMLEVDGVWLPLEPYPITLGGTGSRGLVESLNLTAVNLVYSDGLLVVFTSSSRVTASVEVIGEGSVVINTVSGREYYVEVRYPHGCNVSVEHNAARVEGGGWKWRGVEGKYLRLHGEGPMTIMLSYSGSCNPGFEEPEAKDYLLDAKGVSSLLSPGLIRDTILYYITVPLMYNLMLASIAYAVARLLGGRERIMPRFM